MSTRKTRGFSLIEIMIVLTIMMIASAVVLMGIQPALRATRVSNAYNLSLNAMRFGRDTAIGQRQVYYVTFNTGAIPNTITVTQGSTGNVISTYQLATDVKFQVLPGFPAAAPDNFGTGTKGIDFDQGIAGGVNNVIYFYPDGSAQDVNGNINNGVIYMCRDSDINNARALSLWGATGRLRGWHIYNNLGTLYWRQQ